MKDKSKIPRSLKSKISINEHNKGKNEREKFGYKVHYNSREVILIDKNNVNTLWDGVIAKEIMALYNIGVFQLYPPKTKFENKYNGNACQCIWFLM